MERTAPTWRIPEGAQPVSCWLLPPNAWVDCSGPRHMRFDMTLNGELHLGHVSTTLLNEQIAHRSGGTFLLRLDDLRESSPGTTAEERKRYADQTRAQLESLGVPVDAVTWHSEHQEQVHERMASCTAQCPSVQELFAPSEQTTNWPGCMRIENPFPFLPHSTAATAIQDAAEGRNCLIRGDEMLSQYLEFRVRDRFTNPLDKGGPFASHDWFFAKPYDLVATWYHEYTWSDTCPCSQKK